MTNLIKAEYTRFIKSKIPFIMILIMIGSVIFTFFNMYNSLMVSRFFNTDEIFLKYRDNVFELSIEERVEAANKIYESFCRSMNSDVDQGKIIDADSCDSYLEMLISYSDVVVDDEEVLSDFFSSLSTFRYTFLIVCAFFGATRYSSGSIRREIVSGKSKKDIFWATLVFNLSLLGIFMIIKTIMLLIMLFYHYVFLEINEAVVVSFISVIGMNCAVVVIETIVELLFSEVAIQAVVNVVVVIAMSFVSNVIYPFSFYLDDTTQEPMVVTTVTPEEVYEDDVICVEVLNKGFEGTNYYAELPFKEINELTNGEFFKGFDLFYIEQNEENLDWNLVIHNINPMSKNAPFSWLLVNNSNKACLKRMRTDAIYSFSEAVILSLAGVLIYSRKEFS